ncbi:MAG: hypothetical protein CSA35_00480 [Dethiosulfovibrio peptidovorans]|nr:MAG: hypothetical protein CSA35_00480 [Dethiosulfovibrio peptidovorans]
MEKKPSEKNVDNLSQDDLPMDGVPKEIGSVKSLSLESLGSEIRKAREAHELTLDYVADETKIRKQYLEQIESGRIDGFHGEVYCRGFVKKYLSLLGCMDLWPEYDRLLKGTPKPKPVAESVLPLGDFTPPARGFRKGSHKGVFLLLLAVIIAVGWYLWSNRVDLYEEVFRIQQEQVQRVEEEKGLKSKGTPKTISAQSLTGAVSQDAVVSEEIKTREVVALSNLLSADIPTLTVTAVKDSWIRITREGKRVFSRTLKAGETSQVEASGRLHVIYGRPEFLKVWWNGQGIDPSEEGVGPVHFLYSPDGSSRAISSAEADDLWIEKTGEQMPNRRRAAEEEKKDEKQEQQDPTRLIIKASKADCWIKATRGAKVLYVGTLRKGNETELLVSEDVKVVFGNPTGVTVLVNNVDVGRPGIPGQVGRVVYRPDGSSEVLKKK